MFTASARNKESFWLAKIDSLPRLRARIWCQQKSADWDHFLNFLLDFFIFIWKNALKMKPGATLFAVNSSGRIFGLRNDKDYQWKELPYLGIDFKRVSSSYNALWALGGELRK